LKVATKVAVKVLVAGTFALLWALLGATPLMASDDLTEMSIEELMGIQVYAASRKVQSSSEAPAYVTVISCDEIGLFGDQTLNEILSRVAGFYSTDDRAYSVLGSRGFCRPGDYNSRYLLLINGVRINEGVYDSFGSGSEGLLDTALIERVEIIRGPSSSLYGTSAFFAVINLVTKTAASHAGLELTGTVGSHSSRYANFLYGKRLSDKIELTVQGSIFSSDGRSFYFTEFDDPSTNNGETDPETDAEESSRLYFNLKYGDFTLQGGYSTRIKHDPTGAWETWFNDPRSSLTDNCYFMDFGIEKMTGFDWLLKGRAGINGYYFSGDYLYDYSEEGDPVYLITNRDEVRGFTWQGEMTVSTEKYRGQVLIAGLETRVNTQLDQTNYDLEWPDDPYLEDERESVVWGVFAEDEIKLSDSILLNVGGRYDHYESFGGEFNPRIAMVTSPWSDTTFKMLYSEAFRAPNAYEMYYGDGSSMKGNEELVPEKIRAVELIAEYRINSIFHITASSYRYMVEDLINQMEDPADGLIHFINLGSVNVNGVDFELEGRSESGFGGRIAYSHTMARDEETDLRISNSPGEMIKLTLMSPIIRDYINAGASLRYLSNRLSYSESDIDGHTLIDLTIQARIPGTALEIGAGVYNLFEVKYLQPVADEHLQESIRGDGRNARLRVTCRW
jgi:outer membrane receptor for ferrienterochelin and colicins